MKEIGMTTKRVIDINGDMIVPPNGYYEALTKLYEMIDGMEAEKVDRSDMVVVLDQLIMEVKMQLTLLPDRDKHKRGNHEEKS
jgi:hypothetical protein